ncbi:isochorismatase family protein [Pectobacteriaceae bacterium CE90]|nr:isochorismatase family protein [Prodigiosinella sp. LS101]WJV52610.1 isochorismatase family protein [Prodigiosinella sp. LS101]WJV56964.1 isochorismatase family protein [Pectobacteriaceae bacterium C111]WJY16321.1 isochorismatase family protein [Pectobacteriaceae bacterium CE90]
MVSLSRRSNATHKRKSTARDAHGRDYTIMVVEDACAANSEEEHREAMKVLATMPGLFR